MHKKYIIGGFIIIVFIGLAGVSFHSTLTPYVSIEEAKQTGKRVQIAGQRMDNGQFDIHTNLFRFVLQDEKGETLKVSYNGPRPGNFNTASQVVCKGVYKDGVFWADEILVKCPSKYQEQGKNL
jgi:cytochrome c-type biogenesis protein CcmE